MPLRARRSSSTRHVRRRLVPPGAARRSITRTVPSRVATAFRRQIASALSATSDETVSYPAGTGAHREINRALLLADRAVREWAGPAIARVRPERNSFESLPRPSTLSVARAALSGSLHAERLATGSDTKQISLVGAVDTLAHALQQLDDVPSARDAEALDQIGAAAADVLIRSSAFLGTETFIADQTNETLHDLVAPEGWSD